MNINEFVKFRSLKAKHAVSINIDVTVDTGKLTKTTRDRLSRALETGILKTQSGQVAELFDALAPKDAPYFSVSKTTYGSRYFYTPADRPVNHLLAYGETLKAWGAMLDTKQVAGPRSGYGVQVGPRPWKIGGRDFYYVVVYNHHITNEKFIELAPPELTEGMGWPSLAEQVQAGRLFRVCEII